VRRPAPRRLPGPRLPVRGLHAAAPRQARGRCRQAAAGRLVGLQCAGGWWVAAAHPCGLAPLLCLLVAARCTPAASMCTPTLSPLLAELMPCPPSPTPPCRARRGAGRRL
jgi:hypothetical protein